MPSLATTPRRRLPLLALVLLMHAAVLGWLNASWRTEPAAPPAAEIEMRLLLPKLMPSPRLASRPPAREAHAPPVLPAAPALPNAPAALPEAPAVATLTQVPEPASAPRLNLQLPRNFGTAEHMLEEVHNDPRSHSPRATLESRIADAAGTLPVVVSDSTDGVGSKLIRQGSKCTRVTPSRITTLNPMDARAAAAPAVSGACTQ